MYKYFSAIYRQKYNLHFQPFIDKKRAAEVRRRGRQPKMRGMVGLQRPQADPGAKEESEEENKMICVSLNDDFVLKQVSTVDLRYIFNLQNLS